MQLYLANAGITKAVIWVSSAAGFMEEDGARSCRDTILEIADAEIPIRRFDALSDIHGEPAMILASTGTVPELAAMFPTESEAIGDTDGFAYIVRDGRIYIIANRPEGVYYGIHRFLEDNADILWVRGDKALGTLFERHNDIPVRKEYDLEVPVFEYRGWNLCGQGSRGEHHIDDDTMEMMGRNGINHNYGSYRNRWAHYAIRPFGGFAGARARTNINDVMDEHPEYFMTNPDGSPRRGIWESYINYFNLDCAGLIADRINEFFDAYPAARFTDFSMPDNNYFVMCHNGVNLQEQPYTLPDGRVIAPDAYNYKSTVYWCFLNQVARRVKEKHPDKLITSLAYIYSEEPPEVDLEDNLIPTFAPITGDDHNPVNSEGGVESGNAKVRFNVENWVKRTKNLCVYHYWGCFNGQIYSRPIASKVQKDLKWYAKIGVRGLTPEGLVDSSIPTVRTNDVWNLNSLYLWLCCRLFWNPDADLEELTERYCRLAYGEAAGAMREYYRLIQKGWDDMPGYVWYATGGELYIRQFIMEAGIDSALLSTLERALAICADKNPLAEARIRPIYRVVKEQIELYRKFTPEDAYAAYSDAGRELILSEDALLYDDDRLADNPWKQAKPLVVFKNHENMEDAPPESRIQARLLWDKENLYVSYKVYDDRIGSEKDVTLPEKYAPMSATDSFFRSSDSFAENYFVGSMTNKEVYYGYYSDLGGNHFRYISDGAVHKDPDQPEWEVRTAVHRGGEPSERYYVHAQAIPFASLDTDWKTALPGGMLVHNSSRYGILSWTGGGVWNSASFRPFTLAGRDELK